MTLFHFNLSPLVGKDANLIFAITAYLDRYISQRILILPMVCQPEEGEAIAFGQLVSSGILRMSRMSFPSHCIALHCHLPKWTAQRSLSILSADVKVFRVRRKSSHTSTVVSGIVKQA